MVQAYSLNVVVPAGSAIPFNNVTLEKGCTCELTSPGTIALNKQGVYMVDVDTSAAEASTIQLFVNGIAQPQGQSTGTSPNFTSLVQVKENNCRCNCATSPTIIQIKNPTSASETFTDVNIVVTKLC